MLRSIFAVTLAFVAGLLVAAPARAQDGGARTVRLTYWAAAECPDRATLEAMFGERAMIAIADDAEDALSVTIAGAESGFTAHFVLDTGGESREQTVRAPSCAEAVEALIGALDPDAPAVVEVPISDDSPERRANENASESPPPESPPPEPPPRAPPPAPRFFVGAHVTGGWGILHEASIGGGVHAVLRLDAFVVELAGAFEATPGFVGPIDGEVFAALGSGSVAACGQLTIVRGCATTRLGVFVAEDARGERHDLAVGHLGLRLGIAEALEGVDWSASIHAELAVIRPGIHFANGSSWRAPPVSLRLRIAAAIETR